MSKSPTHVSTAPKISSSLDHGTGQKLSVGRELLDTTWRMTLPVLLFAGLGIAADKAVGSAPWFTLIGTVIGFGFAVALVKRQIAGGDTTDGVPASKEIQALFDKDKDE